MIAADGKKIKDLLGEEYKKKILEKNLQPKLHIIYVGEDLVISKFIEYKVSFGSSIGAEVVVHRFHENSSTEEIIQQIKTLSQEDGGIIVQLPLPSHIDQEQVCSAIPSKKDVDVLSSYTKKLFLKGQTKFFPPVVGAILKIHEFYHLPSFRDTKTVLVGDGLLVGEPMRLWFEREHVPFFQILETTPQKERTFLLQNADILISGVGIPNLIQNKDLKNGVIIFDAGTSEFRGEVLGDVEEKAKEQAFFSTPTKGGIGPLTIAILFSNVLSLYDSIS